MEPKCSSPSSQPPSTDPCLDQMEPIRWLCKQTEESVVAYLRHESAGKTLRKIWMYRKKSNRRHSPPLLPWRFASCNPKISHLRFCTLREDEPPDGSTVLSQWSAATARSFVRHRRHHRHRTLFFLDGLHPPALWNTSARQSFGILENLSHLPCLWYFSKQSFLTIKAADEVLFYASNWWNVEVSTVVSFSVPLTSPLGRYGVTARTVYISYHTVHLLSWCAKRHGPLHDACGWQLKALCPLEWSAGSASRVSWGLVQ